MKKKGIIIGILVLIVAVVGVYLILQPEMLGNMSHSYSEATINTSDISFVGETGDRIKISFRSTIERGELEVFVYDTKGNMVFELDRATALETFFDIEETDTYTVTAESKGFIGEYSVKLYKANSWTRYSV
jgi:hypothetical protein